jgi:hypothetical protein
VRHWSVREMFLGMVTALVALCALAYAADWCVLELRERAGMAHGAVVVDQADVVREKGGKLEYFYNPPQTTPCVHALFPHEGHAACWWLARHSDQQRYVN